MCTFASKLKTIMTTLQLTADLNHHIGLITGNKEMMQKVIIYIDNLLNQAKKPALRNSVDSIVGKDTMNYIRSLSVKGGNPIPDDENGMDAFVAEKYRL